MLYLLIEAERARIKKLQKENELTAQSRVLEDRGGWGTEQPDIGVRGQRFTKEPVSPLSQSLIQDSEWFALSPQEKYAFNLYEKMICSY